MPLYEFRCRVCDTTFEVRRPMRDADAAAVCPDGHEDTVRLLSVFAAAGGAPEPAGPPCGGQCSCR